MEERDLKILVQRNETSAPIEYKALNAYTKGPMYCILFEQDRGDHLQRVTHKFPICSLFRVEEEYEETRR